MNSTDSVREYFLSMPEAKRLKALEPYIEKNERIQILFSELKDIQKKMVSSHEFHQNVQYESLRAEYEKKKEELMDIPFVEEYLELADILNDRLKEFSLLVNDGLDKKINE